ncbi:unnamed protein product, partial [Prorocentrum cordatum]
GKTAAVVSTGPPAESRLGAMNTPQDSMNLRVKRRGTTAFVLCYPEQPVLEVKEKIGKMFDREVNTFRLLHKDPWRDRPRSARSRYRRTTWCTWCSRRGPGAGRTREEEPRPHAPRPRGQVQGGGVRRLGARGDPTSTEEKETQAVAGRTFLGRPGAFRAF